MRTLPIRLADFIAIAGTLTLVTLAPFVYAGPLFTPRRSVIPPSTPFNGQLNNNLGVDGGAYFSRDLHVGGTLNVNGNAGFDAGVTVERSVHILNGDGPLGRDIYGTNWTIYNDASMVLSNDTFDLFSADGVTGYVGVGKISPAYPLDVTGNTRIVGNETVTGDIGAATVDAGVLRAPAATVSSTASVPRCGIDVDYGTKMRFGARTYECSQVAQALGFPAGSWIFEGAPGVSACAQSPADVAGPATTSGVKYGTTPAGENYLGTRMLFAKVFSQGTCIACGAANAVLDVIQNNSEDAGHRLVGTAVIPCTAPVEFCVEACPTCPSGTRLTHGCDSDAGVYALVGPGHIYGPPSFEFRADGGQCTKNPGVRICLDGVQGMLPDGGGI